MPTTNLDDVKNGDIISNIRGGLQIFLLGAGTVDIKARKSGTIGWSDTGNVEAPRTHREELWDTDIMFIIPETVTGVRVSAKKRTISKLDYTV